MKCFCLRGSGGQLQGRWGMAGIHEGQEMLMTKKIRKRPNVQNDKAETEVL